MIYLVGGENQYLSEQFVKSLKKKFLNQDSQGDIRVVFADEIKETEQIMGIMASIDNISLFNNKVLYIIKRALSNTSVGDMFVKYLSDINLEQIDIVFWEDKPFDKRLKIYKLLKKIGEVREFNDLKERELKKWIEEYTMDRGIKIEDKAIEEIFFRVGYGMLDIVNSLKKLVLYCETKKSKRIIIKDVRQLVEISVEANIWEFVDALGERNKNVLFNIFDRLVSDKKGYALTMGMIVRHLRLLILAATLKSKGGNMRSISQDLGIHPFVAKKIYQQVNMFSIEKLRILIRKLFDADLAVKEGKFGEKVALTLFISII